MGFLPSCSIFIGNGTSGTSEQGTVGAGRRATVGVLHSSRLGFMRSFAQIVYSSAGFQLESGF